MEVNEWLQQPPAPEEIKIKDGAKYIPYKVIVDKLNQLSPNDWSTSNFNPQYIILGRKLLVTGTIDVTVSYVINGEKVTRTLSGASNFILNKASNPHPSATSKSLAVMNAVKVLGKQFGWGLNPETEEEKAEFLPVIKEEKVVNVDKEKERLSQMISTCTSLDELSTYKLLANSKGLKKQYDNKLKELSNEGN